MQNIVSDHSVRMRAGFDSANNGVSHRFKSGNTCGVVAGKVVVKSVAAPIVLIARILGLVLDDLKKGLDDGARLRPVTEIIKNVGVDHRVDIVWLALCDPEEPAKLPHLQKLA